MAENPSIELGPKAAKAVTKESETSLTLAFLVSSVSVLSYRVSLFLFSLIYLFFLFTSFLSFSL